MKSALRALLDRILEKENENKKHTTIPLSSSNYLIWSYGQLTVGFIQTEQLLIPWENWTRKHASISIWISLVMSIPCTTYVALPWEPCEAQVLFFLDLASLQTTE